MIIKILLAIFLGFLIGLEREIHGKAVGIKTISLIVLGSTLFCLLSPSIINGDNSRIIAAVVQGVGFLGAGVLIKDGDSIKGLTTAATIWASAAIGCLISMDFYVISIISTIFIVIINSIFNYFKRNYEKLVKKFITKNMHD